MRTPFQISDILKSPVAGLNQHLVQGKPKKKSKYNNVKVEHDGILFDSVKERSRYITLKYLEYIGEIKSLQYHVVFRLESTNKKVADYEADFTYNLVKTNEFIVEDVKSSITRRLAPYRLKKKLMMAQYKIEIKEV